MQKFVVGNLKLYLTDPQEAERYAETLTVDVAQELKPADKDYFVVCPQDLLVAFFATHTKGVALSVGVQDIAAGSEGAYTGQASAKTGASLGARFAIVGHSELRALGLSMEVVAAKACESLDQGLRPIVCVGFLEKEMDEQQSIVHQIERLLAAVSRHPACDHVILAYEPVWAIGTGDTPTREQIEKVINMIKEYVSDLRGEEHAALPVLYGGSVKAINAHELCSSAVVDGALVGGASRDPLELYAIYKKINNLD